MIARGALLVLAVVCAAAAVTGLTRQHDCQDALNRARSLQPRQAALAASVAQDVGEQCDEPRTVVVGTAFIDHAGARAAATALARRLTRETPQAYVGWLTLGRLLAGDDPAASRVAFAHARHLNPRGVPR